MFEPRPLLILLAALLPGPVLAVPDVRGAAGHAAHDHAPHVRAAAHWTRLPLLVPGRTPPGDRSVARFVPRNLEVRTIEILAPDARADNARVEIPVGPEGGEFRAPQRQGNYYWVSARQQTKDAIVTASTVRFFSNPGPAPTELLLRNKGELELIPQPLPREHAYYRAGEVWPFLVRYRGRPLAAATVTLDTEHGTHAVFETDERGVARIAFPLDFQPGEPSGAGGHGPRRAAFALGVEHTDGGVRHLTAFNYAYTPDAFDRKSLWAGLGFAFLGMALAAPLLRRKSRTA